MFFGILSVIAAYYGKHISGTEVLVAFLKYGYIEMEKYPTVTNVY